MKRLTSNMFGCYAFTNTVNDNQYIGSGRLLSRYRSHLSDLRRGVHSNTHFQRAWNKYGGESFVFSVLVHCDRDDCLTNEQRLLDTLKPAYNIARCAEASARGRIVSEETRQKISKASKGHTLNDEARRAIGMAHKGKVVSEETRQRISNGKTGKRIRRSPEHNQKIGAAQRGKPGHRRGQKNSAEHTRKIVQSHTGWYQRKLASGWKGFARDGGRFVGANKTEGIA